MKYIFVTSFIFSSFLQAHAKDDNFRKQLINPEGLYQSKFYTQAVSTTGGRTIYVSGQWAYTDKGELQGKDDLTAQAILSCQNLSAVLKRADASPADVVKVNVYIVNYKMADLAALEAGLTVCFGKKRDFASTLIGVQALARDGMLFEIEAIAVKAEQGAAANP
jgi:2-iminobutanoate/2-iminopropanoate deaminase